MCSSDLGQENIPVESPAQTPQKCAQRKEQEDKPDKAAYPVQVVCAIVVLRNSVEPEKERASLSPDKIQAAQKEDTGCGKGCYHESKPPDLAATHKIDTSQDI